MSKFFDGANSSIRATFINDSILAENTPSSVVAWIKPYSNGEGNVGVVVSRDATGILNFRLAPTMALRFAVLGNTVLGRTTANNTINTNVWQCVAYTWDGATNAAGINLFKNGVRFQTFQVSTNGAVMTNNSTAFIRIGNNSTVNGTFHGLIAMVQIFNRAISDNEVVMATHFPGCVRSGLVGFYPLIGNAGSMDYSGFGNHGIDSSIANNFEPPISRTSRFRNRIYSRFIQQPAAQQAGPMVSYPKRGMIFRHDRLSMRNDLVGTGVMKADDDYMERDTDRILSDFH